MTTLSFGRHVYASVAAGQSAKEVCRSIDACAPPGVEQRRAEAVNERGGKNNQTPLQIAHRLRRGDLVGPLLEEGAEVSQICGHRTTTLALCVCHDLPETLRAQLRKGHDPDQPLALSACGLLVLIPRLHRRTHVREAFVPWSLSYAAAARLP